MKFNIKMFFIIAFYLLLGSLGMYTSIVFLLFPLVNLPMIYYTIKHEGPIWHLVGINGIIGLLLLFITGSTVEVIMYLIFVTLISCLIKYYYKNDYSIPHMIMYTGVITVGVLYIYIVLMKYMGMDFIQEYMYILEEYQSIMITQLDQIVQINTQMTEQADILKNAIMIQVELMKLLYPALFFIMGVGLVFINIVFFSIVAKIKKLSFPTIKQIGAFKFSRKLLILLLLAILCTQLNSGSAFAMGSNLLLFVTMLLEVIGFISAIMLIRKSSLSSPVKFVVGVLSIMMFSILPSVLMMVGMFDTIFNLRKVEIIV